MASPWLVPSLQGLGLCAEEVWGMVPTFLRMTL